MPPVLYLLFHKIDSDSTDCLGGYSICITAQCQKKSATDAKKEPVAQQPTHYVTCIHSLDHHIVHGILEEIVGLIL